MADCKHAWFAIGRVGKPWDRQCGGCSLWLSDVAADLARRCEALAIPEAAAALRAVANGGRA